MKNINEIENFTPSENDIPKDNRKRYFMVVDVETAGGLDQKLTYDVGFAIVDKKGNIYASRSYLIEEIFNDTQLMSTAYYAEKVPKYKKDLANGKHKLVPFDTMRDEFLKLAYHYRAFTICAYNLNFDMSALKNTTNYLYNLKQHNTKTVNGNWKFLSQEFKNAKMLCIWSLACEVLYSQKNFAKFAYKNGFYTQAGNYKTSAEVGYAYMTNNPQYQEEHTGLEDVKIEAEILARCLRQNKKYISGIISQPYTLVSKLHGKIKPSENIYKK